MKGGLFPIGDKFYTWGPGVKLRMALRHFSVVHHTYWWIRPKTKYLTKLLIYDEMGQLHSTKKDQPNGVGILFDGRHFGM
jgi:hypothetical protein